MNFQYPQLLVGLLLVPLSALFLLWAAKRQKRDLARLGDMTRPGPTPMGARGAGNRTGGPTGYGRPGCIPEHAGR